MSKQIEVVEVGAIFASLAAAALTIGFWLSKKKDTNSPVILPAAKQSVASIPEPPPQQQQPAIVISTPGQTPTIVPPSPAPANPGTGSATTITQPEPAQTTTTTVVQPAPKPEPPAQTQNNPAPEVVQSTPVVAVPAITVTSPIEVPTKPSQTQAEAQASEASLANSGDLFGGGYLTQSTGFAGGVQGGAALETVVPGISSFTRDSQQEQQVVKAERVRALKISNKLGYLSGNLSAPVTSSTFGTKEGYGYFDPKTQTWI